MFNRVDTFGGNVGVTSAIPRRMEKWIGVSAILDPPGEIVSERIDAGGGYIGVFPQIPGRIEKGRSGCSPGFHRGISPRVGNKSPGRRGPAERFRKTQRVGNRAGAVAQLEKPPKV